MRIHALLALATITALPVAAQHASPVDERTRDVAGCYDLTLGRWMLGPDTGITPMHRPPSKFRLDTIPPEQFPAGYFRVAPSSGDNRLNIDSWRWIDTARFIARWSANTISGVQLDLKVDGDSLVGRASEFGDQLMLSRQFPSATAVARRAACRPPLDQRSAIPAASGRPGNLPAYRRP